MGCLTFIPQSDKTQQRAQDCTTGRDNDTERVGERRGRWCESDNNYIYMHRRNPGIETNQCEAGNLRTCSGRVLRFSNYKLNVYAALSIQALLYMRLA